MKVVNAFVVESEKACCEAKRVPFV